MHRFRYFSSRFTARELLILLCAVWLAAGLQGCGKRGIAPGTAARPASPGAVVATARAQIGVPYKYGGSTPKAGFDCSGLLYWSFRQHGMSIPRTTKEQAAFGHGVKRADLKPGDIVIFRISPKQGLHTGMVTGRDVFVHSPSAGGKVREEKLSSGYWKARFVAARRVF